MSEYSAKLFVGENISLKSSPSTAKDEVYFLELRDPTEYIGLAECVIVYHWNRHYPSDVVFRGNLGELGFTLAESCDIRGFSHEKITKETYVRL